MRNYENVKIEHFSHFHDISYGHNTLIVRSLDWSYFKKRINLQYAQLVYTYNIEDLQ